MISKSRIGMIEPYNKKESLADSLTTQIELSQELARIALKCPTCRELFGKIVKNRMRKIKSPSDLPSQEENQTSVNPNNNGVVVSNEISGR